MGTVVFVDHACKGGGGGGGGGGGSGRTHWPATGGGGYTRGGGKGGGGTAKGGGKGGGGRSSSSGNGPLAAVPEDDMHSTASSTANELMNTQMERWFRKGLAHGHQSAQAAGFWGAKTGSQMAHPDAWTPPPVAAPPPVAVTAAANDAARIIYTDERLNSPASSGDPHAAYARNLRR